MGPLRFWPILKEDVWGGRRLEALGKHLDGRRQVAESWEIADLGADQSVVVAGPHAGHTVRHLVRRHRSALLGPRAAVDQFPLLLKLLDAKRPLSVQVHPNGGAGKSEAWVVLEAEPGAVLYAGLRPDVTPASLRQALVDGRIADCLHAVHPRVGDVVFLPAGTVHALGAGLVVAELQPTSDITYRLYDWDRAGADGRRRALHVEEALACIHWIVGLYRCSIRCPWGWAESGWWRAMRSPSSAGPSTSLRWWGVGRLRGGAGGRWHRDPRRRPRGPTCGARRLGPDPRCRPLRRGPPRGPRHGARGHPSLA